jgi:hypothetical protein
MTFCKSAVVVCLVAGLIGPLHSQVKPKPKMTIPPEKALPVKPAVCPKDNPEIICVNLCATQLSPNGQPQVSAEGPKNVKPSPPGKKMLSLESPKNHKLLLVDHDEIPVSYTKQEQIVWTCKDKEFAIIKIEKAWRPDSSSDHGRTDAPDFPFVKRDYLNKTQVAGTLLYSGTPVCEAVRQRYKYSFKVGNQSFDPHIIVTGGDGSRENGHHHEDCPPPDHGPKPEKAPVKPKL